MITTYANRGQELEQLVNHPPLSPLTGLEVGAYKSPVD